MKNDEFVLRASDTVPDRSTISSSERTCPECGRQFFISRMDLWAYRLVVKGHTSWFCRYNCVRSAEKKLENAKAGRKVNMNKNKPKSEVLEKDLRAGLDIVIIAKKYDCSCATINNWIKGYGLQGLKGVRKPKDEPVHHAPPVGNIPPPNDMVQQSPSLTQIEQFHTDDPVQELPKVEMDPDMDLVRCADCGESFFTREYSILCKLCRKTLDNDRTNEMIPETYHISPSPEAQGMTEEENMTDAEWEAKAADQGKQDVPLGELWEIVESDLANVIKKYEEEADKAFRAQLVKLVLAVTKGRGLFG